MLALLLALLAPPPSIAFERIAPDTWVATDNDFHASNVLIAKMPDQTVLIVSSPFDDAGAAAVVEWIRETLAPARMVAVNPHFHFDGSGGNAVFHRAGVETWSSDRTRELVERKLPQIQKGMLPGMTNAALRARMARLVPTAAQRIFPLEAGKTFRFGGERVQVFFPGPSHSPDHVVIWLPRRRILFGGCMVKPGETLGYLGDADLKGWSKAAQALKRFPARTVVPGHGRWGGPEFIERTIVNALAANPDVKAARVACKAGRWGRCLELVRVGAPDGKALMAEHWRAQCRPGERSACDQLGIYTDDADERVKAQTWACEAGAGASCYALSLHFFQKNPETAARFREKACASGNPDACEEIEIAQATVQRAEAASAGCERGDLAACQARGMALHDHLLGGGAGDWATVRQIFDAACAKGHPPACRGLGLLHRNGRGVERSYTAARPHFEKGCAGDDAEACDELASLYRFGDGVEQDNARAYALYQKACRAGSLHGCSSQGDMLFAGTGIAVDRTAGIALQMKACRGRIEVTCEEIVKGVAADTVAAALEAMELLTRWARDDVAVRFGVGLTLGAVQRRCDAGEAAACRFMTTWTTRATRRK